VSPTISGSRSGAIISGTWAAILKQGKSGFLEKAKTLLTAARKIRDEIKRSVPEIILNSDDDTICVGFTSKVINSVALVDLMKQRHRWTLNTI